MSDSQIIPVVLFAYTRPDLLRRTLDALKANPIPLLYIYCDAPAEQSKVESTREVRAMAHGIDWVRTRVIERQRNMGLGASILSGVSEALSEHDAVIVWEDDVICAPGTYQYLAAALRHYAGEPNVMSVAAWTHPRLTPFGLDSQPYFSGRFACLGWGAWRRAWQGMDIPAMRLLRKCRLRFRDIYRYGSDIPETAFMEQARNIWAVRFALLHILRQGLCLQPPHSMTEHIGYDSRATNAISAGVLEPGRLCPAPPIPAIWPPAVEHPESAALWREVRGRPPSVPAKAWMGARHLARRLQYRLSVLSYGFSR